MYLRITQRATSEKFVNSRTTTNVRCNFYNVDKFGVRTYGERSLRKELEKKEAEKQKKIAENKEKEITLSDDPFKWTKQLPSKIWQMCLHVWHGTKLLTLNIITSSRLLWRTVHGVELSRRERHLLVVTVADIFRMIPFSFFIIVPFAEFALPFVIKLFPNMLPSTFATKDEEDEKWKDKLKLRMEIAKFVTETAEEMKYQSEGFEGNFKQFLKEVSTGQPMTKSQTLQFVKSFKDDLTIDNLRRSQIQQMCRFIGIHAYGPTMLLKLLLINKIDELIYDDKILKEEGLSKLSLVELKNACASRGMNSLGTRAMLEKSLEEWLDLTLNYRVPAALLILSRAFRMYSETLELDQEIETVARTVKYIPKEVIEDVELDVEIKKATGERNLKGKLEAIREEIEKIKEEKEEEEEEKAERDEDGVVEGAYSDIDSVRDDIIPYLDEAQSLSAPIEILTKEEDSHILEPEDMVDLLEKEASNLRKKIKVEVEDVHTEQSETDYSTSLIETKLKKMVADIEKELVKKDTEIEAKKEKVKKEKANSDSALLLKEKNNEASSLLLKESPKEENPSDLVEKDFKNEQDKENERRS